MKFGEKLKALREREEITQEQLAEELGLKADEIMDLENDRKLPDISTVLDISRKFGITTDYLLRDEISYGKQEMKADEISSERAGKRLLALIMGILSLIILAFTPMFAQSIQMKELSTLGEALYSWKSYILRAPLIYIFLLAAVGLVSSIYLYATNRKNKQ
ncbi:helix-turn-helix domain-containing protein [Bariatricus massiliensis]|uniref:Helix-turn-helix domain-containing protein n=1 Tax=Bariatricus massiliensis TaxID=1745713 RepID=A0ABS8DCR7_9FIRM|nr:helix-turn-helix transcriptional regulator [Bariatricus massiliensis]MCB7303197.1 helix-turn-helix domain-containing protein [Bariatricus massiliensis]MCB7373329.1 helix-turn-helix domain-containing protein [Bariatricus massiliensis]MCB7385999.1 helix-turn-helix domain-containing protein [Bariatricus massiliensis]MCB7410161.1 helix-turn-helix domain-containing protein [Bariatricus massiliensis]MCQ5252555.1 helix-turn-helix domain-containing protein [Bariatricus massiliensis]